MYSYSHSQGVMACLVFSVVFLVAYMAYLVVVWRLLTGITTWTPPHLLKYFLIVHLLVATCVSGRRLRNIEARTVAHSRCRWYYWPAVITFVLHYTGFQVWDVLFDNDGKDEFSPEDTGASQLLGQSPLERAAPPPSPLQSSPSSCSR